MAKLSNTMAIDSFFHQNPAPALEFPFSIPIISAHLTRVLIAQQFLAMVLIRPDLKN